MKRDADPKLKATAKPVLELVQPKPTLHYCLEAAVRESRVRRWSYRRQAMELKSVRSRPSRVPIRKRWDLFNLIVHTIDKFTRMTPIEAIGIRNALDIQLKDIELSFSDLPASFDGYQILHITDPHFDSIEQLGEAIANALPSQEVDLVAFTGDYRADVRGGFDKILAPFAHVVKSLKARDGVVATFGNHDAAKMYEPLVKMGLKVLVNETVYVERSGERIYLTGLDDVHCYYTPSAGRALNEAPDGFKIALIHSPELGPTCAQNGYRVYLAGHTHGGQICLLPGVPLITHIDAPRKYAVGNWTEGQLQGYTSSGAGVVGLPMRFFCQGEITRVTLKRS